MNDWVGNKNSIFKTLEASNHTKDDREENDYYATEPIATKLLLELEEFNIDIWECACGEGHISKVLMENNFNVKSTDLIDRNFGTPYIDFLKSDDKWHGDIITNPPYKYAQEFVEKALNLVYDYSKIAMFLKIQFLEGKKRKKLFEKNPPKTVYISASRLACAKNGDFEEVSRAVGYAWFVWQKGFRGETQLKWFN